jgi:hypothetical protein
VDTNRPGGSYGGGAGGNDGEGPDPGSGAIVGGVGAVRIIWGPGRSFPSTNTGNL